MKKVDWTRRSFVRGLAAAPVARRLSALQNVTGAEGSLFDGFHNEYRRIEAGSFLMGEDRQVPLEMCEPLAYMTRAELQKMFPYGDPARFVLSDVLFQDGDPDEKPVQLTKIAAPFFLGAKQVTNTQYELFDPEHKKLRGRFGFSQGDDEAVIYVSWHDAEAYCRWLAKREGKPYRLPTEAEWEFAARAGSQRFFSMGDKLPDEFVKNAQVTDFTGEKDKVSLRVSQTTPNGWGLYDMHGNVEEWVHDWYAPYTGDRAIGGPEKGLYRVTRGGSHGTFPYYLRSANRAAALPETKAFTIGFRVACGEMPKPKRKAMTQVPERLATLTHRSKQEVLRGPDPMRPYFSGPKQFMKVPTNARGPLFHWHNHDTGLCECPNGDLLAVWYTCAREQGRELSVAASRLEFGSEEWGEAYSFYDTPDRNDHCPALWFDGEETVYHLNGTALSHYWEPLQIIMRESKDNGLTWTKPHYIAPDFGLRTMVCQPIVVLRNGWWIFGADAHPASSAMWLSKDKGKTWEDTGGSINGIHASIVELKDDRLMALGRGGNINNQLPMSISDDYGKTWKASASVLPPVTYTQRFAMRRLKEGPLALAMFLPDVSALGPQKSTDRELAKLCVCISYDDGATWPVRRLMTDENGDKGVIGMSNGRIYMGPGNSEPTAYVSMTQTRNGVIHVLSSMSHYEFNLKWAESGPMAPSPLPSFKQLERKTQLDTQVSGAKMPAYRRAQKLWTNERTGAMEAIDLARGFTVEANVALGKGAEEIVLRVFARSGCTMCNRYWLRLSVGGAFYWYAGQWQKLKQNEDSTLSGTYRLAVREDTCVQIYCGDKVIGMYPASYEIGFAPPTRGNWIEWEVSSDDSPLQSLAYDESGAYAPL
jgi:formylglycine-generating enzyme required for sulfatase activity